MGDARELDWLRKVRDLSHDLTRQRDLRALFPRILDAAVEITEAERGYLVVVEGRKPDGGRKVKVVAARGFGRSAFQGSEKDVSRTVVERVLARGRGLVTTDEQADGDVLDVSSVRAQRVRSIICVPLLLREELRGVLYLDHRFERGAFDERDLPILEAFAGQAVLALETASLLAERSEHGETLRALAALQGTQPAAGEAAPAAAAPVFSRFGRLVGRAPAMGALYQAIERAARTRAPVLILGESGTGKELVAHEIHARGQDARQPFVSENCAAISESVLESELFGHRQGAFTGAVADHDGLFVQAGRGTLFMDEVGDMSPGLQAHLLRVLQEGKVRPLGGSQLVDTSCRVIAATHRDLPALVTEGVFRQDLYYRLDVLRVVVPPLRERLEDLELLIEHFLEALPEPTPTLSAPALRALRSYPWPGNVRELRNEVLRLTTLGVATIEPGHLSLGQPSPGRPAPAGPEFGAGQTLAELERQAIEAALRRCEGNKSRAARELGIPRTTLYALIERHGLE